MEKIIKYIIRNDFKKIENIIDKKKVFFTQNEFINLINYFFFFYHLGKLNDFICFQLLHLSMIKYKIVNINDISININLNTIFLKNKYNYNNKTDRFLRILYGTELIDNKIINFINDFKKTNGSIKNSFNNVDSVNELYVIIKQFKLILESFNDNTFIKNLFINHNHSNMVNLNTEYWLNIHSEEIKLRLVYLIKIFGTNLIKKFGISFINENDFNSLSFNEKVNYYLKCIKVMEYIYQVLIHYDKLKKKSNIALNLFNKDYKKIKKNKKIALIHQ